jgi:ketosteroid isomerase-like protein
MKTTVRAVLFAATFLPSSISPFASGQAANATSIVNIRVTDPTGAPIPRAHLRIVPYPLPLSRKLESSANGTVNLELNSGKYEVFVQAPGFRSSSKEFEVADAPNATVAVSLQIGSGSYVEITTSRRSPDEEQVWELEKTLWKYLSSQDMNRYDALWEPDAVAWRDEGYFTVGRQDVVAWLRNYQARGLELYEYSLGPTEIRASGNAAVAYYTVSMLWLDKLGRGTSKSQRVAHTWVKAHGHWRLIGENIESIGK